jgi:hypothetical protein
MPLNEYQDDSSISDDDILFRRVNLRLLVRDDDTGLARVSSGAFRDKDKQISVDIKSVLDGMGLGQESCITDHKAQKLVSFAVGEARRLKQAVCRAPLPENPSHGLVCGSKSDKVLHGLAAAADWVIPVKAPLYEEIEAEKRAIGLL